MKVSRAFCSVILTVGVVAVGSRLYAGYQPDEGNRLLVVTVESGEEAFDDANYGKYLTGSGVTAVTNVIKLGDGTLVMGSADRSSYTGDFTVEAGTLSYAGSNALGSLSAGTRTIFVKGGATLARNGGGALKGKTVYFEGTGADGSGALWATGSVDNPWGQNLAMTGDALISGNGEFNFTYGTTFEMNGHTLTARQRSNSASVVGFKGLNFFKLGTTTPSPGTIIVDRGLCYVADGRNWKAADGVGTLILTNAASFKISGFYPSANLDWSWVWASGSPRFDLHQNKADAGDLPYQTWKGPLDIRGVPVLELKTLSNTPRNADMSFAGKVSGGGFHIEGTGDMTGETGGNPHLHLLNGENDFTNGVAANLASVHIWRNGALPANGGNLVLTNSAAYFCETNGETYALSGLEVSGTGLVSKATGSWSRGVVKRGAGELVYDSLISMPSLAVEGGSVRLPASGTVKGNPLAGLIGGVTYSTYSGCTKSFVTTNAVELSPAAMYSSDHEYWKRDVGDPDGSEKNKKVVTYAGYLWNRTDHDVTWTFAGCAYMHFALYVNGEQVIYESASNGKRCVRKTVVLHPGANAIQIRDYATGTTGAPIASNPAEHGNCMKWDYKGFPRYIPNAEGSDNQDDYLKLEDPGDGSLLTWALPDGDLPECIPGTETPLKTIGDIPVMSFVPGTSVDMGGNASRTDSLSGFTSFENCPSLTVGADWTLKASEISAGGKLETDGKLVFSAGAKLVIDDSRCKAGSYTVAEAEGGIVGDPEIEVLGSRGSWQKSVQADKIVLTYQPDGLMILLR